MMSMKRMTLVSLPIGMKTALSRRAREAAWCCLVWRPVHFSGMNRPAVTLRQYCDVCDASILTIDHRYRCQRSRKFDVSLLGRRLRTMYSGKRNATVWRPSVSLSVCLSVPTAYTHSDSPGAACDAASVPFGPTRRRRRRHANCAAYYSRYDMHCMWLDPVYGLPPKTSQKGAWIGIFKPN